MAESIDRCEGAILGQALANGFQATTDMALLLSRSLCELKRFDPSDITSHYLYLYHQTKCDIGQATVLVYEERTANLITKSNSLKRKELLFPIEKNSKCITFGT